jgi:hypothetical protein
MDRSPASGRWRALCSSTHCTTHRIISQTSHVGSPSSNTSDVCAIRSNAKVPPLAREVMLGDRRRIILRWVTGNPEMREGVRSVVDYFVRTGDLSSRDLLLGLGGAN